MADLKLNILSNIQDVEKDLKTLTRDRTLNLKVHVVDDQINTLTSRIEQLERSAKDTAGAMNQMGSAKNLNGVNTSLQQQLQWLKKIEAEQLKISKINTSLEKAKTGSNKDQIPLAQYQQYIKAVEAVSGEMGVLQQKVMSGTFDPKVDGDTFTRLSTGFSLLNSEIKKFTTDIDSVVAPLKNIARDKAVFDKIGSRLTDYYARYETQLTKNINLYNKWQTLLNKANSGSFASAAEANREFAAFRTQARAAGIEIESFGTKLQKTFGTRMRSALSGYGVYALETALRDVVQNAISVDTAMTELKKVTSETDAVYTQFLEGAEQRAQRLGATLSEVVQSTSDYARLGYNIDQATMLADSALIYSNVGDDVENIDDATAALISTMQGLIKVLLNRVNCWKPLRAL